MINKELETRIKQGLRKKSKDTIIELYLQMRFERNWLQEQVDAEKEKQRQDFNVGDKVTIVFPDEITKMYGNHGVVIECNKNIYSVKIDGVAAVKNYEGSYLKKVDFKVGDKARVTKGRDKGEIVEIRDIRDNAISVGTLDGSCISVFDEDYLEPYTEPRWTFTDDEKVILRNLPEKWKWIARDEGGELFVYENNPRKEKGFKYWKGNGYYLTMFSNLFQSIKWNDEQPCEFRKFI